ncbi:LOW QUALITY PROTEIN: kazrin-A [Sinocyclocheilus anshuiensis]|uniref:LOW QUALITY PROTEIN: kazrin-A n=1 Tax=Sinocyclocheilus anshuiensis TaxID=1608454 RepID=UPI0007BAAE76|nr:PREDICTED: LOW QUALITY PROTEIN: kazrin-A-like [Sinocyclocheilus anshuiensis]
MMEENKQLAQRIDGAIQCAKQEVANLRAELTATGHRLAELGELEEPGEPQGHQLQQQNHHDAPVQRQKALTKLGQKGDVVLQETSLDKVLLHEEVVRLQEEVSVLKQVREMLNRELEETGGGCSVELLSVSQLRVQLTQKEQELDRAKEALQAMKADRKRLRLERTDLVNQMQQLYTTLESREEQLRDFIRNYEQHRKESEDAVRVLAREKDLLEREKWDLRRQTKEATEHASALRSALDLKENRIKELEAELTMAKQSLATLTKDVPKRHSLAMPTETVVNGNQEWAMHAELPLTAAIRQSQQNLYHSMDRQVLKASPCVCDADGISMMSSAAARISPCHSKQPSVISDASVMEGERSSTPSDSPRHRTHSLCNSLEDLEEQRRRKKKERMGLGSLSRVFGRGKQRKSLDPTLFDDSDSLSSPARLSVSLSECEEHLDRLQQVELARMAPMSRWRAGTVQAWLEVIMAMPMYIRACADNVKSGKVLLVLTNEDLEFVLGISNSMHRRKLRLAIEDYRDVESGHGLSKAADLDHHWVAQAWLTDVGLPQYSQFFHTHLVDGRLLSTLTRTDLEKHLHVSKKAHQISLLLGIQLLHTLNFDKEILQSRRSECENQNTDPVVWTCHRIIKWIKEIDLKEFADNLQSSGVHGAIMVMDPSFSSDTMAAALCIPSNKHMVRHHLNEEVKALVSAARAGLDQEVEPLGTPPTLHRQSSLSSSSPSLHDDQQSLRRVKQQLGLSPKNFTGRKISHQNRSGSFPRNGLQEVSLQRERCPVRHFSAAELTNV